MRVSLSLLLFTTACATPSATRVQVATHEQTATDSAGTPPDALICERREVTGSRLPVTECHTKAERDGTRLQTQTSLATPKAGPSNR